MLFTTEGLYEVAMKVGLRGTWTQDQWIPFQRSNQLSYLAMSSSRNQSQLYIATPISLFVQYKVSFDCCLWQLQCLFWLKFSWGNHMSVAEWMMHMVFTAEGFFEVATENWPDWDLNLWTLNFVLTLWSTEVGGHEFKSHLQPTVYSYCNFIICSVWGFTLANAFLIPHSPPLFWLKFSWGNHRSVVEIHIDR